MSNFSVTILGCGSATPTLRHFPSAQAVAYGPRIMLVDCGEGAQLQMQRFGVSFARVRDIFISHLHGDHFLGLPGLLSTMALHGVEGTVTVHIFEQGAEVLAKFMEVFCPERPFSLEYDIMDPGRPGLLMDEKHFTVSTVALSHRVPCFGFVFREKPKLRHIDGEAAKYYGVPHYAMQSLREGADFVAADGATIPNARLTREPSPSRAYAYCSDTAFEPSLAERLRGVDVIYHEATYGDADAVKAAARGHSTARQAAEIAAAAGARELVIGHYSKMVSDPEELAAQAREIFANTVAATEGLRIDMD